MVRYRGHIEDQVIKGMRLGRRPHDPERPVLRLADILTGQAVPAHGVSSDHLSKVKDWGLYNNDKFGICGPTMVGNARKQVTKYLTSAEVSPPQADVDDLYRRSGNPGFNPAGGGDDNGVVLADMLSEVHKNGIGGIKSIAYAAVDVSNEAEVQAAIDIFGDLHLGVSLQTAQQRQTNTGLWDYKKSGVWGGHAVLAGAYTGATTGRDIAVITWATVVGTTDAFWAKQVDEAWVVIWPEHLGTAQFQLGINTDALNAAYMALTGSPGPFTQPSPTPAPTPAPAVSADAELWAAAKKWAASKGLK
jgi:hypothetical protein